MMPEMKEAHLLRKYFEIYSLQLSNIGPKWTETPTSSVSDAYTVNRVVDQHDRGKQACQEASSDESEKAMSDEDLNDRSEQLVQDKSESGQKLDNGKNKDSKWLTMFKQLKEYKGLCGDCLVPRGYAQNARLASWVAEQR